MKTYLDCIPCFFKLALQGARIANANEKEQKIIIDLIAKKIPSLSFDATPPEMGKVINNIIIEVTNNKDPFYAIKQNSNKQVLLIYDHLKMKIVHAKDSLLMAVKLAIAGNIIDYGANINLKLENELERILKQEDSIIKKENKKFFAYEDFKTRIIKAKNILYLADNAGEIVFDKLLIEEILRVNSKVNIIFAVRDKPAINDVLIEDALFCGLDQFAEVISSGSDAPGTILSLCTPNFIERFNQADVIISKGQGNFEALSDKNLNNPIFFMLIAKCPQVAKHIGCELGNVNLLKYFRK